MSKNELLKSKKEDGFTLIELIVVMAILAILILLAGPRILGYRERAQLRRIQYDVKVMEGKVAEIASNTPVEITQWDDNEKNLSLLAMTERLYEEKGIARSIDRTTLGKMDLVSRDELYIPEITSDKYRDYKIIPKDLVDDIRSKLPGTFYANYDGKVYYEHDKALTRTHDLADYECTAETPSGAYTFNKDTNTIEKYDHDHEDATKHLVIPSEFNIDGVCYPVLNIGKGAFMVGDYFHVVIPEGIKYIHPEAFERVDKVITITLPGSMGEFHAGGKFENIIVNGSSGSITIHGGGGSNITYTGSSVSKDYEYTITGGGSSGGSGGSVTIHEYTGTDRVITVPSYIEKDGVKYPVTAIEEGAYQGKGLISVVLPEGLKRIEDYAFARNQLIEVNIPKSVEHIGHYAFAFNEVYRGDWETSKDRIPTIKSVKILSEGARERYGDVDTYGNIVGDDVTYDSATMKTVVGTTDLLKHVFIQDITSDEFDVIWGEEPSGNGNNVKPGKPSIKNPIEFDGVEYEDGSLVPESSDGWFRYTLLNAGTEEEGYRVDGFSSDVRDQNNGQTPTAISIPSSFKGKPVVKIADGSNRTPTFTNVKSLVIPDTIETIGNYAFDSNGITSLHLGKSVKNIGHSAFYSNSIKSLSLPASIETIGTYAFRFNSLTELVIPDKTKEISSESFGYNNLEKVHLPASVGLHSTSFIRNGPSRNSTSIDPKAQSIGGLWQLTGSDWLKK